MKLRSKLIQVSLVSVALVIALGACAPRVATPDPTEQAMSIAQTLSAYATRTAIARPSETPTSTLAPTNTIALPSATAAIPTASLSTTPAGGTTPQVTATTYVPGGVDSGVWAYSEPADGSTISSGGKFTAVVTLMNVGTTTWNTNYYIQFADGEPMGANTKIMIPYDVGPGLSVQISIDFTAPSNTGDITSTWSIMNPAGIAIGIFWFEYTIV